jgi:hypothetical protein
MSGSDERDERDLNGDEEDPRERRRVIDVSDREPVVVEREPEFPFAGYAPERMRVYVAQGGRRACAIPLILILLILCCACISFWILTDNLF